MSATRKQYPSSFKAKVALAALREDAPVSELAIKYGVHATVIHRWKKEALAGIEAGFFWEAGKARRLITINISRSCMRRLAS
jgi:transposase-like protein